jgi:Kef-type K+ transport system membrane component KefB
MEAINVYGIALVPVVLAMVELLKRAGIPKKLSPIVSIVLGILAGFYYLAPDDPKKAIFLGLVVGLSAIGLFSGTKNTIENLGGNANKNHHKSRSVKKRAGVHK